MRDKYRGMYLGRYSEEFEELNGKPVPKAVVGLGFGDEGKGMTVAFESGRMVAAGLAPMNVRFNGGPQAAHNVRIICDDGRVLHLTHSQFGSGSMLGAKTVITNGMLFDPISFLNEAGALACTINDFRVIERVTIDSRCPVVIPSYARANRVLEQSRGEGRHGSTGLGIGIARACEDAIKRGEQPADIIDVGSLTRSPSWLSTQIVLWRRWIEDRYGINLCLRDDDARCEALNLHACMRDAIINGINVTDDTSNVVRDAIGDGWTGVVFEGSQGMLLDERYGWFPHVTYGDMTPASAIDASGGAARVIGVTRSYQTRHGAGPMPTEGTYDADEPDNGTSKWAGEFRTGILDLFTVSRMAHKASVDSIAVSCLDRYPNDYVIDWKVTPKVGPGDGCWEAVPVHPSNGDESSFLTDVTRMCGALVSVAGRGNAISDWSDVCL